MRHNIRRTSQPAVRRRTKACSQWGICVFVCRCRKQSMHVLRVFAGISCCPKELCVKYAKPFWGK